MVRVVLCGVSTQAVPQNYEQKVGRKELKKFSDTIPVQTPAQFVEVEMQNGWHASGGGACPGPKRKSPNGEFDAADDAAARPARKAKVAAKLSATAAKQLAQLGRRGSATAAMSEGEVKDAVLQMGFEAKAIEAALAQTLPRKQKIRSVSDMVELILKMSRPPRKSKAPVKKAKSISGSSSKTSSAQALAGVDKDLVSIQKRVRAHVSQILRERSYLDAYERPSWGEQHGYSGGTDADIARKHSTTPVTELARAADRIQVTTIIEEQFNCCRRC